MAVREIIYEVSAVGISPATEQHGGTQTEHRAAKLTFNLTDELRAKITAQAESGKAVYRFDAYDGEGNVVQGVPQELGADTVPEFYLEEWLTHAGGRIRVYLVITVIVNESTEMELYSFPALLKLNNLPDAVAREGENQESPATLAQTAMDAARSAELIAQSVRDDADNGAFKGDKGDRGEQGVSGVYVGSGDMPEGYNVQIDPDGEALDMNTLATKEYVDSAVSAVDPQVNLSNYPTKEELAEDLAPIQQSITDMSVDYIVEQGNNDIWTWEKWNSGKAVCWCKTITSDSADPASIYFKQLLLPFEFTNDNYIVLITSYQSTGVGSFAFQYYKRTTTEFWVGSNDPSITANVYVIGKWK